VRNRTDRAVAKPLENEVSGLSTIAVRPSGRADTDRRVVLRVEGMTCGACAARVERTLNRIEGVTASVNYATSKARISVAAAIPATKLLEAVRRAGYSAEVVDDGRPTESVIEDQRVRELWPRLVVAVLLCAPLGDVSIALALAPSLRFPGWQWAMLVMTIPVATWCAWPFHRAALRAARHGATSMDTLISLGVLAASVLSLHTIFFGPSTGAGPTSGLNLRSGGAIYLDVAAGVTVFLLAGRLFEAKAKHRAGGALRALALAGAREVSLLDGQGQEHRVPASRLRVGDRFVVHPGETVATDGLILEGRGLVDTSAMTGESAPVQLGEGERVLGATIGLTGRLVVEATRIGRETQLGQLIELVDAAQNDKAAAQRIADRISSVFVPVVLALAGLTFTAWLLHTGSAAEAFGPALATLVIACPCALGLATPTALLVASGRGAQLGIFIKGHQALETARRLDVVVLDKTGTLTEGRMSVVAYRGRHGDDGDSDGIAALRWAAAVEAASEHPIGRAISEYAQTVCGDLPRAHDFRARGGLGAIAEVEGCEVVVGSARMLTESGVAVGDHVAAWVCGQERLARTVVLVAVDGVCAGAVALADAIRPSARPAVAALGELGLTTVLLTGDNPETALAVAREVGIGEVLAGVLPAEKAAAIERLRGHGRSVAMVGDGINDAPALAKADLGMAIGSGTDAARGASDLILMREDLRVVPRAVRLARATVRTIRWNLVWAFGYNIIALPLAALGLLNPLVAGGAMAVSSLLVVSNSLRLRRFDEIRGGGEPGGLGVVVHPSPPQQQHQHRDE
jgi:heavy metal translocating P-type ATPase